MKRLISVMIVFSLLATSCTSLVNEDDSASSSSVLVSVESSTVDPEEELMESLIGQSEDDLTISSYQEVEYTSLSDPALLDGIEAEVYFDLIDEIGDDYYIENVTSVYISQEYIDELTYNSQSNVFFGYTLEELNEQFDGTRYVFTVDDSGQTVVEPLQAYDDTYDQIIKNVAIGAGVILLCVTVSAVTFSGAPAVSMIFALSAQGGAVGGLTSGVIGGVAAGLTSGFTTGDWDQAVTDGALAASQGFMIGAITGAIAGGITEGVGLRGATCNGLTMDEAAIIQRETKLPLSLIREFQSMDQYYIVRDAGLRGANINGAQAVIRDIDLTYVDEESGLTNLQLMQQGNAPLDPTGTPYELHHLGQSQDSVLAILTQEEHRGVGNFKIWHQLQSPSEVDHGAVWAAQKQAFWRAYAALVA